MHKRRWAALLFSGVILVGCEQQSDRVQSGIPTAPSPVVSAPGGLSQSGSASYQYLVGSGILCSLAPVACPDVTRASNGDTVEITGEGTLSIHAKSVTGGGTFIHRAPNGSVRASGTWTATQLLSFNSYGTAENLPATFEGGFAVVRVHLSPGFDGILQVNCAIGKVPPGHPEGVRLAVQEGLNFNQEVSGFTLFIRQS